MILSFTAEQTERDIQQLADLLIDAVDSGASVGFMPPLTEPEAFDYWRGVIAAMRDGSRILLVAAEGDLIQGSVQMDLETRANGKHRAEAIKLFVHRRARRQGLAKGLMAELESIARNMGRTLLLTDTRKGGDAEKMCESLGYIKFGEVPNYARTGDGRLNTSSFFYKQL
jgi:acetyltransferase